jgi:hypothetical protein
MVTRAPAVPDAGVNFLSAMEASPTQKRGSPAGTVKVVTALPPISVIDVSHGGTGEWRAHLGSRIGGGGEGMAGR